MDMRCVAAVLVFVCAVSRADGQTPAAIGLRAAIAEALAASPRLAQGDDGLANAQIHRQQAASRFATRVAPSFTSGSDVGGLMQRNAGLNVAKRLPFGTEIQASANSLQYGEGAGQMRDAGYTVGFSQPLLATVTQSARWELESADRGVKGARDRIAADRQQLVVSVADAYLGVIRARRLAGAAARALERASKLRDQSAALAGVVLATELDVLRADLLVQQARANASQHREAVEAAADALKAILGRPLETPLDVEDVDLTDDSLRVLDLGVDPALLNGDPDLVCRQLALRAMAVRPEVTAARERMVDARRAETMAHWNLLPPVTLAGSYTRRGLGGASSEVFDRLFSGWRFSVSSNYTLDRASAQAAAASAAVAVRTAERQSADVDRQVAVDVRQALRAWQRTAGAIDNQNTAMELAGRQLRITQLRFERGLASSLEVVDAETTVYQVQAALESARVDRAMAGLVLRRSAGLLDPDAYLK
jgi:outer membrane protein TolC